jgi:hypothetical protein
MPSGFDEFKRILKAFSYLSGWAIAAGAPPFLGALASLAPPPWPKEIVILTAIIDLTVLIFVYQFSASAGKKRVNRRMRASAIVFVLSVFAYLFIFNRYTFVIKTSDTRIVKGFVYTEQMKMVQKGSHIESDDEILSWAEYMPSRLWKKWSIDVATQILNSLWVVLFASLSAVIGLFIVYQRRRHA